MIGGSGFIGRRLVRFLTDGGAHVRVVDTRGGFLAESVQGVPGDLRNEGLAPLRARRYGHGLQHPPSLRPAGPCPLPWETYEELNVDGARHVCSAAERCGVSRVIFSSSAARVRPRRGSGREERLPAVGSLRSLQAPGRGDLSRLGWTVARGARSRSSGRPSCSAPETTAPAIGSCGWYPIPISRSSATAVSGSLWPTSTTSRPFSRSSPRCRGGCSSSTMPTGRC